MNNIKPMLAGVTGIFAASLALGAANEDATLNATITAGALEIEAASVNGPWAPAGGAVSVTGANQADALQFNIDGITINDLNGDGLGWVLTASPDATLSDGSNTLARGTVGGFNNASNGGAVVSTVGTTGDTLTYASGTGVSGLTVDYDVAYDVPALATAGSYSGVVAFAIVAQ